MKGIGILGARTPIRIPSHRAPNQQAKPLADLSRLFKAKKREFEKLHVLKHIDKRPVSHEKNPLTFHYTACLIGSL